MLMQGESAKSAVPETQVCEFISAPVRANQPVALIPLWIPRVLIAMDTALLGTGLWLSVFSPLAGSVAATVVTSILVLIGAGLACVAVRLWH